MSENLPLPTLDQLLKEPQNFAEHTPTHWRIINSLTGEVVLEVPKTPPVRTEGGGSRLAYNPAIIDMMCSKIVMGETLADICTTPGFPTYDLLCRWRRTEPWINEALDLARKDRAERYKDLALKEALAAQSAKDAPAQTLKVETYKWSAGVDDPKMSPKAKVDVAINTPTQIVVVTGIDRAPRDVTPDTEKK